MPEILSAKQKALKINLDPNIYGTFAEIGAGQEVARWFFKAGGASGTIAKTMSAYDMIFSDTIYGKEDSGRYVSESRLHKMLQYEYDLLEERLREHRGKDCRFFAFANTVSARNFALTNESHGWIGVRFKNRGDEKESQVIIHVRMLDTHNIQQQEALGIIGVSVVHSSYFHSNDGNRFLDTLMENIGKQRIEINMIRTEGPAFEGFNDHLLNLELVKRNYTNAIMFNENGGVVLPDDELYKKNILLVRGSYRPPTLVNFDMIKTGLNNFCKSKKLKSDEVISIAEITMGNLTESGEITNEDFLARVNLITELNQKVLITNFPQYFKLTSFFASFKPKNLGFVMGCYNFGQIFDHGYRNTAGGPLEALGKLFREFVTVYLYPYLDDDGKTMIDVNNLKLPEKYEHLYKHILSTGQVIPIEDFKRDIQHIYSRKVLKMILCKEKGWEDLVPTEIAKIIIDRDLFTDDSVVCSVNDSFK